MLGEGGGGEAGVRGYPREARKDFIRMHNT